MPVFWFALSFVKDIHVFRTVAAFLILHCLVYPSSNGYNSYMDRDVSSIGGIKSPLQPTKELYIVTLLMDALALFLSLMLSYVFGFCVFIYIIFSRLYSYRRIRLKQYPLIGYITVILNQGSLTFFMVYYVARQNLSVDFPFPGIIAAAFLIGGFYPITQIYQHQSDKQDEVKTISMLLGKKGTFIFCAVMYMVALGILFFYYNEHGQMQLFLLLQIFFIPVLVYFIRWFLQVVKNETLADFKHTMQMNWLASTCTSLAFITLILLQNIG